MRARAQDTYYSNGNRANCETAGKAAFTGNGEQSEPSARVFDVMLKGIDPLLGPELLAILRAMGHGDEIVIADANFPSASIGRKLVRADGVDAPRMVAAILSVMPLDDFADAAFRMAVVGDPHEVPPITLEFENALRAAKEDRRIEAIERQAFYDRARNAFAVVATGETRLYGNLILKKGLVRPTAA